MNIPPLSIFTAQTTTTTTTNSLVLLQHFPRTFFFLRMRLFMTEIGLS